MKKQYIIAMAVLCLFTIELKAQNYECRIDTVYHYKNHIGTEFIFLYQREINTYDQNNNKTQRLVQNYNLGDETYSNAWMENFYFNASGQLIEEANFNWNSSTNAWEGNSKSNFVYNQSAPHIIETEYDWNNSDWVPYQKYESTLNSIGYTIERIRKTEWNGAWYNNTRFLYEFNSNNQLSQSTTQQWNQNNLTWINYTKSSYTYSSTGKQTQHLSENWSTQLNAWQNNRKITTTYNAQDDAIQSLTQDWSTNINDWVNYRRSVSTGNTNPRISEVSLWDVTLSFWLNESRSTYTYDDFGNQIELFYQEWDVNANAYINGFLRLDYYDNNNFKVFSDYWGDWNQEQGYYNQRSQVEFICTAQQIVGLTNEFQEPSISIYPNPILPTETLKINSQKQTNYQVFNLFGQQIAQGLLNEGDNQINISQYQSGVYFFQIENKLYKIMVN